MRDGFSLSKYLSEWVVPKPDGKDSVKISAGRTCHDARFFPTALSKLSDLEMLVMTSGGRERTAEELGELFAAAGLRLTRVVPTAGAAFVLEGLP